MEAVWTLISRYELTKQVRAHQAPSLGLRTLHTYTHTCLSRDSDTQPIVHIHCLQHPMISRTRPREKNRGRQDGRERDRKTKRQSEKPNARPTNDTRTPPSSSLIYLGGNPISEFGLKSVLKYQSSLASTARGPGPAATGERAYRGGGGGGGGGERDPLTLWQSTPRPVSISHAQTAPCLLTHTMCACINTCTYIHIHTHAFICIHAYMHTYIYTRIHTHINHPTPTPPNHPTLPFSHNPFHTSAIWHPLFPREKFAKALTPPH